jgi:heat-inducible transcriptional repressor
MRPLTSRERQILFSLVTEYIATGEPVASGTLCAKYGLELRAASVRGVMVELEQAGFLVQPHTSAGRMPTESALRAFIDALSELNQLPGQDIGQIRRRIEQIYGPEAGPAADRLRQTGKVLSELSGAAAVVAAAPTEPRKLAQLRFIRTRPQQLLAVLVFADGMVENRYLDVDEPVGESELEQVHNLLGELCQGRTLPAVREMLAQGLEDERQQLDALQRRAFALGHQALRGQPRATAELVIEGQSRLMELPEYSDVERLRALGRALEAREQLLELLDKTLEAGAVSVYIGSETGELGGAQLSLVVAPYGADEQPEGTVGVIGPTRMDYARMLPLVGATAAAISDAIKKSR